MSLKTPLSKAIGLGSAKEGMHHWKMQRLTAIALIPLTIWFICKVICLSNGTHADLIAWLQSPWCATLLILFLFSMFYHMALGLQVVIEDYVHTPCLKYTMLIVTQFGAFLFGLASIISVVMIAAGE